MSQPKDKMSEIDEHITKRFDIQKRLGKGAYGIVWKAIDRRTKDVVAVKKIFDAFRNQTDAQRTFREIMFLQSFKAHPNIVKLHSIHRAANNRDIYLGFEYMETDLHNVIKRGNILKEVHKKYIMYQLLKALKYIHSGNVIHRDLKPSNVLLDSLCRCKIADFGLARLLPQGSDGCIGSDSDPTLTDYVATRWYRAPEILIANRSYTKGIDMWSIGCILAEMCLGKPVFPGTSTVNQVEKIMSSIPSPSPDDISMICSSGVGSSMIKNAATLQKVSLRSILGNHVPDDAINLINKLLIFNPNKRLTAEEALKHPYVSRFHDPEQEVTLLSNVVIPLNDDVRLTVDEYRNKLYELMSNHNKQPRTIIIKPKIFTPEINPRISKSTEKYMKNHLKSQDKCNSHSDSKMNHRPNVISNKTYYKMVPKETPTKTEYKHQHPVYNGAGDCKVHVKSKTEIEKKRIPVKLSSYNSYNNSYGVITQNAFMELRAAGLR